MCVLEPYAIVHLEPEWVRADETMGSKDKSWFLLPDRQERWLFKYARVNQNVCTGEDWAEKIAAEIAELLSVPHCLVELAKFEGRRGSLSRRFPELLHTNERSGFIKAITPWRISWQPSQAPFPTKKNVMRL